MGERETLIGLRFNKLVVIEYRGKDKNNHRLWLCHCDCGGNTVVRTNALRMNRTKGCGCLSAETARKTHTRHGHTSRYGTRHSLTYTSWLGAVRRGTDSRNKYEAEWYSRVKICKRWLDFSNFLEDMGERPSKAHSLDRINNKKGYCKSNCRWATRSEQARNTRKTVYVKGKKLRDLCDAAGQNYNCVKYRLAAGWAIKDALGIPSQRLEAKS